MLVRKVNCWNASMEAQICTKVDRVFFYYKSRCKTKTKFQKKPDEKPRNKKKRFFFCQIKFLLSIKDLLILQWFHCKTAQLSLWLARPFNPYRVKILRESIETIVTQLKLVFQKAENKRCILLWSLRSVAFLLHFICIYISVILAHFKLVGF